LDAAGGAVAWGGDVSTVLAPLYEGFGIPRPACVGTSAEDERRHAVRLAALAVTLIAVYLELHEGKRAARRVLALPPITDEQSSMDVLARMRKMRPIPSHTLLDLLDSIPSDPARVGRVIIGLITMVGGRDEMERTLRAIAEEDVARVAGAA
jgi:hypothetical protein